MLPFNKPLPKVIVVCSVMTIAGCIAPNSQYPSSGSQYNAGGGVSNYPRTPVDVSDLYNTSAQYAESQLRARGFQVMRASTSGRFDNRWWLNQNTDQCFVLETAQGKVMTLNSAPSPECRSSTGGGAATQMPAQPAYGQGDALVPGTNYHATGNINCYPGGSCPFGVRREGNGSGMVTVTRLDGRTRTIYFSNGRATGYDQSQADTGRLESFKQGDMNMINIGQEHYEIPDAVIFGG